MTKTKASVYFLGFVFAIVGFQCESAHKLPSQKTTDRSIYIDQFKLTYFRQMLVKGYNNSKAIQEIINSDHSGFTEPVLTTDDFKLIDSLTTADNKKMQSDSTRSIGKVAEGAEGKHPLGFMLKKLNSKWFDSLAINRYKSSKRKEAHFD